MKNPVRFTGLMIVLAAALAISQDAQKVVRYSDFGAKGDGKTDDMDAIVKAHEYANQNNLPVKADDNAEYYIGGAAKTAIIKTDTDFGTAKFTIDDRNVEKRGNNIFLIAPSKPSFTPDPIKPLKRFQKNIGIKLPEPCLVVLINKDIRHYIRYGANQNDGSFQKDVILVDKDGNISPSTPLIWDFEKITDCNAYPIDEKVLTIKGGIFTTIANQAESKYTYYGRNISIRRSNVVLEKLKHYVTGEGDHGAPYSGFIGVTNCANVTIRDTVVTGHKTYNTIGSAKRPVSMGTYDLGANTAVNVSFINVTQTNDILDRKYWGIMGTNYCKNLLYDGCKLSRFDAHQGVANATIRNSTLGHAGTNTIGFGTFTMENCISHSTVLINLRSDYGSTWEGTFVIKNCTFIPGSGKVSRATIIGGNYTGRHNFGYTCHMPEKIIIDGLTIKDKNFKEDYGGPAIFSNFNYNFKDETYKEKFPSVKTKEIQIKNLVVESGKTLRVSPNTYMFKDVKITYLDK